MAPSRSWVPSPTLTHPDIHTTQTIQTQRTARRLAAHLSVLQGVFPHLAQDIQEREEARSRRRAEEEVGVCAVCIFCFSYMCVCLRLCARFPRSRKVQTTPRLETHSWLSCLVQHTQQTNKQKARRAARRRRREEAERERRARRRTPSPKREKEKEKQVAAVAAAPKPVLPVVKKSALTPCG